MKKTLWEYLVVWACRKQSFRLRGLESNLRIVQQIEFDSDKGKLYARL